MSLAITGDVLAVVSAGLLTFGTGAQALANFGEYRRLRETVTKKMGDMYRNKPKAEETSPVPVANNLSISVFALTWINLVLLFRTTKAAAAIRAGGGKEGVELAQFFRTAEVWGIIAIGSVLALIAALIQLRLGIHPGTVTPPSHIPPSSPGG